MRTLGIITNTARKISEIIIILLLFIIILLICLQVFSRFVLDSPINWTMELIIFCFQCLVMIGASLVFKDNRHVKVDIFLLRQKMKF